MKKVLLNIVQVCLLNIAVFTGLQAQNCSFTQLRLNSQAAVNSFDSSCKTITGNITINGTDITDLHPLKNIESIDGNLTIQNNFNLPNLKGLEKLAATNILLLYGNTLLTDLSGLEGLKSVSNTIHIRYHPNLTSLKGLDNLAQARYLYISNNDLLVNFSGLGNLESVTEDFSISLNKSLTSLTGLTKLTSASRILLGENDSLTDLTGLESLQAITYQMHITSNKNLTSLNGLTNLTTLSELYISDNNLMTDMSGLENLGAVKWLVIGESKGLTSFSGLHSLQSATNFIIRGNPLLTDLSGLEGLTSIGWIQISENPELVSLSGLGTPPSEERIGSNQRTSASLEIGGLSMTDNPKLTSCAISSVCDFIAISEATISGNGAGCETQAAVEISCASLPVTLRDFSAKIENQSTNLQWVTTEESNSSVFEIEHSVDARNWKKAGEHAAKGESNQLVHYQWTHTTPEKGLNYYRLKMIDLDDSYAFSGISKVKFNATPQNASYIYPNPASDFLFVENVQDIVSLRIINLSGKTVHQTTHVPAAGVSLKKLARGLYQVHIIRQDGKVQAHRVAIL